MAILKADPAFRRRFFLRYGVAVGAGVLLISCLPSLMKSYTEGKDPAVLVSELRVVLFLIFLPFVLLAYRLYRLGRRVSSSDQFPPPGTPVLFDTEIRQGPPARGRARVATVLAIALLVIALAGMFYLPYAFERILRSAYLPHR